MSEIEVNKKLSGRGFLRIYSVKFCIKCGFHSMGYGDGFFVTKTRCIRCSAAEKEREALEAIQKEWSEQLRNMS
jgi:hypothetical protein